MQPSYKDYGDKNHNATIRMPISISCVQHASQEKVYLTHKDPHNKKLQALHLVNWGISLVIDLE